MKRSFIVAALLSLTCAVPAFAADGMQPSAASTESFDQKQTRILKMIDERIAGLQEARACAQAATSDDNLKACREQQMSKMNKGNMNQNNNPR